MKLNIQLFAVSKSTSFSESNLNSTTNTSSLKITVYFSPNNSVTYFSNETLYCSCNGSTQSAKVSLSKGGSVTKSFTFDNIAHNSDGTKTVSWSWNCNTGTSVLGNISDSGTKTLTSLHKPPLVSSYTMTETNALLTNAGVADNVFVENLSQKQFAVNYTLYDNATLTKVGVINRITYYGANSSPFTLDFSQITLYKDANNPNKVPIIAYVKDSFGTQGTSSSTPDLYSYIPYVPVSITATTNARRVGQLSGQVELNIDGIFYNGVVGNIDQTSYKPTIKYKYWEYGTTEPVNYTNTISSSDITVSDGTFNVSSLEVGSTTETDPNYFDPEKAYRFKIYVEDNFTSYESSELSVSVGEATWTEYKDRVDFKRITKQNGDILGSFVLYEGNSDTPTEKSITLSDSAANYDYLEIFYIVYANQYRMYYSVKVDEPNGKTVGLFGAFDNGTRLYEETASYSVSGTSLTRGSSARWRFGVGENQTRTDTTTNDPSVWITKVVGYK